MRVVILSNYLNHHTLPLCKSFLTQTEHTFHFVATTVVSEKRLKLGYKDISGDFDFLVRMYEKSEREKALQLCLDCDVLLCGAAPDEMIRQRLKQGKLTFKITERIHKIPCPRWQYPLRKIKYHFAYERYPAVYLLCSGAYTSNDFFKNGAFRNRAFKWGYFPPTIEYPDVKQLIAAKQPNTIVWAARMIDWKHPELPLEIARRLKADGFDFELNMIGSGELQENIQNKVQAMDLGDRVKLPGSMPPEQVRQYMEQSAIFLMTSDRQEGWGAVLNEAMNSACAVVANSATGAAPYLVKDGENGFLYNENNLDDLYQKVRLLLENPKICAEMGEKAYNTILSHWNGEHAAQRLIALSEKLLRGEDGNGLFADGICSTAPLLEDGWYQPTEM